VKTKTKGSLLMNVSNYFSLGLLSEDWKHSNNRRNPATTEFSEFSKRA
jgi:hypothetical protein